MIFTMEGSKKRQVCVMPRVNLLLSLFMLFYASGASADGNVTMESLTIYKTHEWFGQKPTVYFRCREESKVYLPDVVKKDQMYGFMGQESWQPLTTLYGEKCKRCGLYEQDTIKTDDTFYETELCPKDFMGSPEGRLILFKEKEFNASLLCPGCIPQTSGSNTTVADNSEEEDEKGAGMAFLIIFLVILVLFVLGVIAYSKWRQKQRREQQARFVKMFEDDDDLDAELGLKDDL